MVKLKEALRKEFGTSALEPDIRLALCLTAVMSADASPPLGLNRVGTVAHGPVRGVASGIPGVSYFLAEF